MSLQDVFTAPLDYDNDITITYTLDEQGHVIGFQYGVYNSRHGWTWKDKNKGIATPDINAMLLERGEGAYSPINKCSREAPFNTYWDYRQQNPIWIVFRGWIFVYYADKECKAEGEEAATYLDICTKMYDDRPDFEEAIHWAEDLAYTLTHDGSEHMTPKVRAIYAELEKTLSAYREKYVA